MDEVREQARRALEGEGRAGKGAQPGAAGSEGKNAIRAQIIQWITMNKIARRGDVPYQLTDGKKIKKFT